MPPSTGFVAYASAPSTVGDTIEAALRTYTSRQGPERFISWRENEIAGRFLADPILEDIEKSQ